MLHAAAGWLRRSRHESRVAHIGLRIVREVAILTVMYAIYRVGRMLVAGEHAEALSNAASLRHVEMWLHLPSEESIQDLVTSDRLLHLANVYYVSVHFPLTIIFLAVGFMFRPHIEYVWARNLIAVQTLLALALHMAIPLAPPRMFPQWGFVDTMTTIGPSAYDGAAAEVANQFAAMPSLHVGWAALITVVVAKTGPKILAVAAGCHLVLTTAVVVVTANHWWLDGIVAIALLIIALAVVPGLGRARQPDLTSQVGLTSWTGAEGTLLPQGEGHRALEGKSLPTVDRVIDGRQARSGSEPRTGHVPTDQPGSA